MDEILTLDDIEARILGCLIEKEKSTPEYYPLTINSLLAACNQKTNRHPVMSLEEDEIEDAIERMREKGLVVRVDTAGSRVPKFRHQIDKACEIYGKEIALMAVLLLRGPQTVGELRGRTERMASFESLQEVENALNELLEEDRVQLIVKLPIQPGQKEVRYAHLLSGEPEYNPENNRSVLSSGTSHKLQETQEEISTLKNKVSELDSKVEFLELQIAELQSTFENFKKQFE
jgi:uncharacterized protein YceH (UPF0502 family)